MIQIEKVMYYIVINRGSWGSVILQTGEKKDRRVQNRIIQPCFPQKFPKCYETVVHQRDISFPFIVVISMRCLIVLCW
jgi:hypothetical protein